MSSELLPIKFVVGQKNDYWSNEPPGNVAFDPVVIVTPEFRQGLAEQVDRVSKSLSETLSKSPNMPAVAKVSLHGRALAKSKRPTSIFNTRTCPIVGGGDLGKVFVYVNPRRLENLRERIVAGTERANESHVSTIQKVF